MLVVSDCQLSHRPDYIIGWSSIQPAGHPACFDISYDVPKNLCTECINTKIDGWAILVKNDPFTKIRGKEKVAVHKQHVGFDVEKSYRNLAVAF